MTRILAIAGAALVAISFEWGHLAASVLAAAVGAAALAMSGLRRSRELAIASYSWLGVVLLEAFAFDSPEFYGDGVDATTSGGLAATAAAAGLLGGAEMSGEGRREISLSCRGISGQP